MGGISSALQATLSESCLEPRLQDHYSKTSQDERETWLVPLKQKKEAYDTMIIPVGGKTEDKDDQEGRRTQGDMEPFTYHSLPSTCVAYLTILRSSWKH